MAIGSGSEVPFGKITGVVTTPTADNAERPGFTKATYSTKCSEPDFAVNMAGGNKARFNELRARAPKADADVHGDKGWDSLPGTAKT